MQAIAPLNISYILTIRNKKRIMKTATEIKQVKEIKKKNAKNKVHVELPQQ